MALKAALRERFGFSLAGEVYELPCHRQPIFEQSGEAQFPAAEEACASHICLPMSARMSDSEAESVVAALESAVADLARVTR
jgi:dTDP-4-amino-4,6-dideoxygalactose transaminase